MKKQKNNNGAYLLYALNSEQLHGLPYSSLDYGVSLHHNFSIILNHPSWRNLHFHNYGHKYSSSISISLVVAKKLLIFFPL